MTEMEQFQQSLARRQYALQQMDDDLQWLIDQPAGTYVWTGTHRDLIEMIDIVWHQGVCLDGQARPLSKRTLASRAFRAIGKEPPRQLSRTIQRIRDRQSPTLSILYRYEHLHAPQPAKRIIHRFLATA